MYICVYLCVCVGVRSTNASVNEMRLIIAPMCGLCITDNTLLTLLSTQ